MTDEYLNDLPDDIAYCFKKFKEDYDERLDNIEKRLSAVEAKVEDFPAIKNNAQRGSEVEDLEDDLENLDNRVDEWEAEISSHESAIDTLESKVSALENDVSEVILLKGID